VQKALAGGGYAGQSQAGVVLAYEPKRQRMATAITVTFGLQFVS